MNITASFVVSGTDATELIDKAHDIAQHFANPRDYEITLFDVRSGIESNTDGILYWQADITIEVEA
jgi:hypothetical protein